MMEHLSFHTEDGAMPAASIRISRNARGDAQWEIVVREGATKRELERLRRLAVGEWRLLERTFGMPKVKP